MELHLKIIGLLLIPLGLAHGTFGSYFKWKTDLQSSSLINQQMMLVHTLFIGITLVLMGLLCFFHASDLIETPLGNKIALGLSIFWGLRLFFQFFVYSPLLWKGKFFETTVHILFSLLWIYLTVVFLLASAIF